MKASSSEARAAVGREILGYLRAHPGSEDSLEGIVEWWLLQHYVARTRAEVRAALADLVSRGLVLERANADGRLTYRLKPRTQSLARKPSRAR